MTLFNTDMHVITFIISCIEIVILFYQIMQKLARPKDKQGIYNIILLSLLLVYNIASGLLPDPQFWGTEMLQNIIAYAVGFIAPAFFPFYVYKSFGLEKMRFHAYKGVFIFLILPFFIFSAVYAYTGSLTIANNVLAIPLLYAFAVIYSLVKAIRFKYRGLSDSKMTKEEGFMMLSLIPWVAIPIVVFFDVSQATEALISNGGFLMLLGLQIKDTIVKARLDYEKLINWNSELQSEVDKRTEELKRVNDEKTTAFINVAHEIKTPLTLINNYLDNYIERQPESHQLNKIKKSIEKLNKYVANFFDIEKVSQGLSIYNNDQVTDLSGLLNEKAHLFNHYADRNKILFNASIENGVFVKAAPEAIDRIINNLLENAFKFTSNGGEITLELQCHDNKIYLSVTDNGVGIEPGMEEKIFQPYYQINNPQVKKNHGLGLGLPIVKKIIEELGGSISVKCGADGVKTTSFLVVLTRFIVSHEPDLRPAQYQTAQLIPDVDRYEVKDTPFDADKQTLLLVEDNMEMHFFLSNKLKDKYNIYSALNGEEAISKLKEIKRLPDLIISDIMMDSLDGFGLLKALNANPKYKYIPLIFLSARSNKKDKLEGLELGAVDFIEKPFSIDVLKMKIDSILSNVDKQRRALVDAMLEKFKEPPKEIEEVFESGNEDPLLASKVLSKRELEIAMMVKDGLPYKQIAAKLDIVESTVTKHIANIYKKLQVTNRIEMIKKLWLK